MKILIVDDKKENLYLLETLLKGCRHEVESASDGEEALKILYTQDFDMIISDILMPVMDGFQLCRKVMADNELKNISFIFYTATYTSKKDEELALKLGADRFIIKPAEPEKFIKIIQGILGDKEKSKIKSKKPALKEEKETFKLYSERLVNKLEKRNCDLEKEITGRKRVETQIKHLNLVLRTIRNVNQLIVREKNRDVLIQKTCELLVENRGYNNAWIVLLGKQGEYLGSAEAGLGESFAPMKKMLKAGKLPDCGNMALKKEDMIIMEDTSKKYRDCPLSRTYTGQGGYCICLRHGDSIYGLLTVLIPSIFINDEEEQNLFREVGEDIGFALNNIEEEKKHKQAKEELKKHRDHLEELVKERTAELEEANKELKRYNRLFEGREFRIKELRDKVKELKKEAGSKK